MSLKIDGIATEEELQKAQAAAQAQGYTIPNYQEWADILDTLALAGVKSTGSYAGDKAKVDELEREVDKLLEEAQEAKKNEEVKAQDKQVRSTSESDNNQDIKANLANATSSMIMADYMKYYHLMS